VLWYIFHKLYDLFLKAVNARQTTTVDPGLHPEKSKEWIAAITRPCSLSETTLRLFRRYFPVSTYFYTNLRKHAQSGQGTSGSGICLPYRKKGRKFKLLNARKLSLINIYQLKFGSNYLFTLI